jgi:hypothetical protein
MGNENGFHLYQTASTGMIHKQLFLNVEKLHDIV